MRYSTIFRALYPPLVLSWVSFVTSYFLWSWWSIPFLIGGIVLAFDLWGRTGDLIYLSSRPPEYFTPKVLDRYGRSWCGRSIVVALQPNFKIYYRAMKYRWYHLLPDGSLSKNSPFLRLSFWINLSQGHKR